MCDYSLDFVASRPAKVGDKLVSTQFRNTITRGFTAIGEPHVAVCLLPGTELAFEKDVEYEPPLRLFHESKKIGAKVAQFRRVSANQPLAHHARVSRRPNCTPNPAAPRPSCHRAAVAGSPCEARASGRGEPV
jgi:hypothetical protein